MWNGPSFSRPIEDGITSSRIKTIGCYGLRTNSVFIVKSARNGPNNGTPVVIHESYRPCEARRSGIVFYSVAYMKLAAVSYQILRLCVAG